MESTLRYPIFLWFIISMVGAAEMPGLEVGDRAPNFKLISGGGETVTLDLLLRDGPAVLVFVRSADWCPFCKRQLKELEKNRAVIEASGARIAAISYDSAATQAKATDQLGLTYPLLADEGSQTIEAYGILNRDARGNASGLPYPAIFVVGSDGTISAKLMEERYQDRPSQAVLAATLANLD